MDRHQLKIKARAYFQKNIDNVSTGTEGFPDTSSFIYGFMEGYTEAMKQLDACEKALKTYQRAQDLTEANKLAWEYFSKYENK